MSQRLWLPTDLGESLILWLDSEDASTVTKDGANRVTGWADKSSYGHHTTANGNYLFNEAYDGEWIKCGNCALIGPTNLLFCDASGISIFASIITNNIVGSNIGFIGKWGSSYSWAFCSASYTSPYKAYLLVYSGYGQQPAVGIQDNLIHIMGGVVDTNLSQTNLYIDAVLRSQTTAPAQLGSTYTPLTVGSIYSNAGYFTGGKMGDVIVVKGGISTENRQCVEGWIAHKRDATANLPADHPYKDSPPMVDIEPTTTPVPDLVGLPLSDVNDVLAAVGLERGVVTDEYSITVPLGDVISQDPVAGTEVEIGSSVAVTVSLGTNIVTVPSVIGMTEVEATSALGAVFLVVGNVTTDYSITVPAGKIMTQDPVADTEVIRESAVDIVLSLGLPIVTVPDLIGMTLVEADAALAEVGLLRGKTTGVFLGPELQTPIVKSQSLAALTEVVWGSIVDTQLNLGTRNGLTYAFEVY